jgi:hypothetical protein
VCCFYTLHNLNRRHRQLVERVNMRTLVEQRFAPDFQPEEKPCGDSRAPHALPVLNHRHVFIQVYSGDAYNRTNLFRRLTTLQQAGSPSHRSSLWPDLPEESSSRFFYICNHRGRREGPAIGRGLYTNVRALAEYEYMLHCLQQVLEDFLRFYGWEAPKRPR